MAEVEHHVEASEIVVANQRCRVRLDRVVRLYLALRSYCKARESVTVKRSHTILVGEVCNSLTETMSIQT